MTDLLLALSVFLVSLIAVALAGWIQAERVIVQQRQSIKALREAHDELQEAVHAICVMLPDQEECEPIGQWGAQIH